MKKSFPLIKLVSIVSGKFIPDGGIPGLMEICQFLIGTRNEGTIDIPPILNATKTEILKQHPWINDIKVPTFRSFKGLNKWSENLLMQHKKFVEFERPSIFISRQEIFEQTMNGVCNVTGMNRAQLTESTNQAKKLLGVN